MYCPLACHFCSKSFQNKIKQIQYRSLKLITNDYNSDYKFLPNETGNSAMEIKRLRTHAFEIFKTLNSLNPTFMKDIFISLHIVLTGSMIYFHTVEIHQIMVVEASELLDHKPGTSYQKILNPLLL